MHASDGAPRAVGGESERRGADGSLVVMLAVVAVVRGTQQVHVRAPLVEELAERRRRFGAPLGAKRAERRGRAGGASARPPGRRPEAASGRPCIARQARRRSAAKTSA